jgi:protein-S-isoprenylcysteine O-methyltransferase Ste14
MTWRCQYVGCLVIDISKFSWVFAKLEELKMRRWLFFVYGVAGHVLFLATFAYLVGFVGNFLVPKSIDSPSGASMAAAVTIDLALLALFAAQHSIMARPAFKRVWTRIVPEPIERSTYVLAADVVTILLMWQWRSIDHTIWDVQQPVLRGVLWCLFALGFLLVPLTSLLINHFDLFGTRQVWLYLRGREYEPLAFRVPSLYKHVRHPLYVGMMMAFWAAPTMSAGHLLFATVMTAYIVLAASLEERDLVAHFGQLYGDYCRRVPMFIPRWNAAARERAEESTESRTQLDSLRM